MEKLKKIRLTPGPVAVPVEVTEAIAQPVIHHRSAAFESMYAEMQGGFRYLFQTQGPVLAMNGTGTLAVEAMITSLVSPGEKVLVPSNGKFSQRWAAYATSKGLETIELQKEWGARIEQAEILDQLEKHPETKALILTHCETSTGVDLDLEGISFAVRSAFPSVLILVDAISTVGVIPFYMDVWGIDGAVVSSQKSLMNPTGTAFVALSERATALLGDGKGDGYMDLGLYYAYWKKNSFPYSAPVQLFYGVNVALRKIQEETLPVIWNRVQTMATYFRKELMGLEGQIFGEAPGFPLTAFSFPKTDLVELKSQLETSQHILVAAGQGPLHSNILRVSHFGAITMEDMVACIQAIKEIKDLPIE